MKIMKISILSSLSLLGFIFLLALIDVSNDVEDVVVEMEPTAVVDLDDYPSEYGVDLDDYSAIDEIKMSKENY